MLGIHHGTAAAHGKAHNGPLALAAAAVELSLHGREELLEEEILIGPSGNVEIAVLVGVDVGISGVWHKNHKRDALSGGDELICHPVHAAAVLPGGVVVGEAVKEHNQGIMIGGVIPSREVHVVILVCVQNVAVEGMSLYFLAESRKRHANGGKDG